MPLYLVRHGETDWNREKRFQSRTDVPLNARGISQAQAIRAEFEQRGVAFAQARCSPLGRAVETARIILDGTGIEAQIEESFIEVSFGEFEGRLEVELREEFGKAFTAWRANEYTAVSPAGGESIVTAAERVRPALLALTPAAAVGNVVIVAHQAINMAMKVALSGMSDVANAASYRQNNDEVDIWDMTEGCRLGMFKIETGSELD